MHSRCCCPPDSPSALFFSRSLTSSQMAASRRDFSTISSSSARLRMPWVPGPVGHVVVDAHGKGIGLLEHHAHLLAQPGGVQVLVENILAFKAYLALDVNAGDQVIHAVEGFEKRGLAAAGGADEGRDLMGWDLHIDVF